MNSSSRDHEHTASIALDNEFLAGMRHEGTPGCLNPDCGLHPYYGVAPHECYYKKGPEYMIGQSTLLPQSQWPDNFVLDLEPGEDPETGAYPNACGVYYCPACLAGHPSSAEQVSGDSSRDDLKPYEAEVGERQP
jgi:hypothetical protein